MADSIETITERHAGRAIYDLHRPAGPGLPVLLAVPHSGRDYGADFLARSRLDAHAIRRSEDAYVDALFRPALDCGAAMLAARFPRAWLDVNRESCELDPAMFDGPLPGPAPLASQHVVAGLGVIPRLVAAGWPIYDGPLDVAEAAWRIAHFYCPWHARLAAEIADIHARFGICILLDCHSMPGAGAREDGAADIVLGDCFGLSAGEALLARLEDAIAAAGLVSARNHPYAGGYITRHYGRPHDGVHAVQIEIARALYMDEARLETHDGFARIAALCRALVRAARPPEQAQAAE